MKCNLQSKETDEDGHAITTLGEPLLRFSDVIHGGLEFKFRREMLNVRVLTRFVMWSWRYAY